MKKILSIFVFLAVSLFSGILVVNAQSTATTVGPDLIPESAYRTSTQSLTSQWTARGNNTFVYFTDRQMIGTNLQSWSNRILTVKLYEEDFTGGNDLVKTYRWTFSGRALNTVGITTHMSGDIEASGDRTAELYLQFYMTKNSDDWGTSGHFFKYYYGIN